MMQTESTNVTNESKHTSKAALSFLHSTGETPYNYAFPPPSGTPWENYEAIQREVVIFDARYHDHKISIDVEGYVLQDAPSSVRNFTDQDEIISRYYTEVAELARLTTGATKAYVFDHLVRKRDASRELDFGRAAKGTPVSANGRVHNDYTEQSGRKRMDMVFERLGQAPSNSRFAIVNVWRSIKAPVLDTPLAVCDARSVDVADLIEAEVRYTQRIGEIYLAKYATRQRWAYFSAMDRHEALVFKQYDSQIDNVARFTPHAAFLHPQAPIDGPPRESIEARCLVVFE
jgi:hypothetical protein